MHFRSVILSIEEHGVFIFQGHLGILYMVGSLNYCSNEETPLYKIPMTYCIYSFIQESTVRGMLYRTMC